MIMIWWQQLFLVVMIDMSSRPKTSIPKLWWSCELTFFHYLVKPTHCCYYAPTIDSCPIHARVDRTVLLVLKRTICTSFTSDTFDMLPITSARYSQVIDTNIVFGVLKHSYSTNRPISNWKSSLVPTGALWSRDWKPRTPTNILRFHSAFDCSSLRHFRIQDMDRPEV